MTEIFPLRSRQLERQKRAQTWQHVGAAILLMTTAWTHLTDPHHHAVVLPVLEMIAAAGVIVMAAVEQRRKHHARVGWFEIAGAAMLFVEAIAKLDERHHRLFYVLQFLPPIILLTLGLLEGKIRGGTRFEANDDSFFVRTRALFGRRVKWEGLRTYRITSDVIELFGDRGRKAKIKLKNIYEPEAASAWAEEQFTRRGLRAVEKPPTSSGG